MNITDRLRRLEAAPAAPIPRLCRALGLPSWIVGTGFGVICVLIVLIPVFMLNMSAAENLEILGNALFFGLSMGIIVGCQDAVLSGAKRDLEALKEVLPLSSDDWHIVHRGLDRMQTGTTVKLCITGVILGLAHNYLLDHHLHRSPFIWTQGGSTLLLWLLMMVATTKMVQNAILFSRLGASALPDLLRPSRHAAFGSAALRPGIFLIGLVCSYGLLAIGDPDPFDDAVWIGVIASTFTLVGIIALPLRGIRRRIRETRAQDLASLDARIEALAIADFNNAEVADLSAMDTLLDMRERVARAPGWPLDIAGLQRILVYIVLPPLTWAAAAVVEMLIEGAV